MSKPCICGSFTGNGVEMCSYPNTCDSDPDAEDESGDSAGMNLQETDVTNTRDWR